MTLIENWKRWLTWALLVSFFSVACFFLSQWQFNRRAEAIAKIQTISRNFDLAPISLNKVVDLDSFDVSNEWRPVLLNGKFLSNHAVLVRNRPYNGSPGFLQVVPFELDSGEVIAIETGWIPTGSDNQAPKTIPLPPENQQEIVARVRPVEPTLDRDAPAKQIATINVEALIEKENLEGSIYKSVYARLANSYTDAEFPKVLPKPELSEGNHLSYALQWILFALMAFGALAWAIKQEAIARRMKLDPNFVPKVRKRVGDADKLAEDAVL
jgi:cytochrome oxidase assembly protein ShyY1